MCERLPLMRCCSCAAHQWQADMFGAPGGVGSATRADFEASVAIHPTIAEEFVTFGGWGQTKGDDGKLMPQLPPYLQQPTKFSRAPLAAAVVAAASVIALVVMAGRRS
jgi:hypothetical protein